MPELKPFRGLRYSDAASMKDLTCPPYDIISPDEQEALHDRHEHNAVRLELAKQQGPEGYSRVAETFRSWLDEGVLRPESVPALYVYRQDFSTPDGQRRKVAGVIGGLALEEFGSSSGVLPHERTMPGPIEDRLALLGALQMNVSPIYGIYRGGGALEPFFDSLENRPTASRFADEQGILHRCWVVSAPAEIEMLTAAVGEHTLVIADGHHRYETALRYHRSQSEPGEHDAIMCFCVDADSEDLVVLPYNRAVRASSEELEAKLLAVGGRKVEPGTAGEVLQASGSDHPFVFVLPGTEILVEITDDQVVEVVGDRAPAWRSLDVVALHEVLLPSLLGEGSPEFRFSKDPDEVRRSLAEGWSFGVLLRALSAAQIVDVARSGERMPQKASYFWPKAVTGLVFRSLR